MNQTETRQVGRALGTLATIAIEALSKPGAPTPADGTSAPAQPRSFPLARRRPRRAASPTSTATRRRRPSSWRPPATSSDSGHAAETAEAQLLLRAMIAAARADGTVDKAERAAIATRLDAAGLTAAERDHVLADFDHPASIQELAAERARSDARRAALRRRLRRRGRAQSRRTGLAGSPRDGTEARQDRDRGHRTTTGGLGCSRSPMRRRACAIPRASSRRRPPPRPPRPIAASSIPGPWSAA
jgi:hypothetical protein